MKKTRKFHSLARGFLLRTLAGAAMTALIAVSANAASPVSTTINVSATGTAGSGGTSIAFTGTASLTNIGSGTFNSTVSLTTYAVAPQPFTITITSGSLTGTLTGQINLANFLGTTGTGSATITGGSGNLANATGSFPSLSGTLGVGLSFTLTFNGNGTITPGSGGSAGPPPTISQVLNNYGLIPAGFANAGIAQGSLFIIKGSNLADPNAQALPLQDSSKGLPTTLNGASVSIKASDGKTYTPVFYYAIGVQLALVMPSNVPKGAATVSVSYNNQTSSTYSVNIVPAAMGFDAYYGTGSGLGVATNNVTGALYNYSNSIPPGTSVVLWGSGLGADPARDTTYTPAANTISGLTNVYIGGMNAPIVYQGASGYPGLNQVNITIPVNAPTGCNVSLVGVNTDGTPTNFLTLPIGNGPCSDPTLGLDGTTIQTLSNKNTVNSGTITLVHQVSPNGTGGTTTQDTAGGFFSSTSGASYASSSTQVSPGACTVLESYSATGTTGTTTPLDAGTLSVTGPNGSANMTAFSTGSYVALLTAGFIPTSGGTFNFTGTGSTSGGVGSFQTSLTLPNPLLTWTNQSSDATITRSGGVTVTWSGGASGTFVSITGSATTTGANAISGSFTCIVPQTLGSFAVPSYVLGALPAGNGTLTVGNSTNYATFKATNLDFGLVFGGVSYTINAVYN